MLVIHLLSGVFTITSSVQFPFKVSMLLPISPHGLITATVYTAPVTKFCHPNSPENSKLCCRTCSLGTLP